MSFFQTHIQSAIYESFVQKDSVCYQCHAENLTLLKPTNVNMSLDSFRSNCKQESIKKNPPQIIVCTSDEAYLCYQALSFLISQKYVISKDSLLPILLPDIRAKPFDSMQSFYAEFRELFAQLALWYKNGCTQIIISPTQTLMSFMPNKQLLDYFVIHVGEDIATQDYCKNSSTAVANPQNVLHETSNIHKSALERLIEQLLYYGYESVEIVEMQGEFSHRGDIIDIFIPNTDLPVRLSFFDTEVESIRYFDYQTQLSKKEELDSITIYPALFSLNAKDYALLESKIQTMDSVNNNSQSVLEKNVNTMGFWFLKDIGGINFLEHYSTIFSLQALIEYQENLEYIDPLLIPNKDKIIRIFKEPSIFQDMAALRLSNLQNTLKLHRQKQIAILSPTNALLKNVLNTHELSFAMESKQDSMQTIITPFYLHIQSQTQIFISLQKPQKIQRKAVKLDLDSLKVGDFVVHNEYGVGIFQSIQQVSIMGGLKDFISIVYANEDKLLLPVENLNMIEKYTGFDNAIVKLDKLGKSSFLRLKDSIKEKLLEIANEIIKLQAQRELSQGAIISLQSPQNLVAYKKFEESRGFELTKDQSLAIQESLKDLASGKVMDRLLNGDVGFGKTEVAMNLCFVSALNDFISFVLVPTTLLCNQHFESFKERFQATLLANGKQIAIAKIDRFTTAKQKEILQKDLADGKIQIVIGTHALFNLEVKKLGLIVIDEEHKFGVKQKEILKQKSLNTHVLSMSATPIPRTLNMAYSKLKAISHLYTPPTYKQESKTFVKQKQDSLIKEIIMRELRRGGQVFYIYNNIAKMPNSKSYLLGLLPHLRILVLHSQVNPKDMEKGMIDFLHKQYDILLCTSIVESGVHLPNANTIIIDNADNFGIADLHQLRGRVGRGKTVGFCYLLVNEIPNKEAQQRLLALEKNSYLGSGANLAMRDLEIRGGGNLLGQAQSGHIKHVGFGMYVRMLEETLHNLLQSNTENNKVDLKLSVSAFLNDNLITSERMRLELYRRLAQVQSEYEVHEIENEIEERFGKLDIYSLQFLELIIIKILATQLQIKAISNMAHNISLVYHDNTKIVLRSPTKDDDDILLTIKEYLKEMLKRPKTSQAIPT
ncbi:transcription-repair coupling factor [Helicobacter aurati]|uniref:Transcription-repair-coupling factor n=1 Tax=Helicobacter aurati TaxID=137778 RepID=A0A3D8J875_9HELI|nr:DEAD/DEAH box helicase [Helicobacter aurati]RDU73375.1 transcription-repair coupling factor [Helicobacter aurati]